VKFEAESENNVIFIQKNDERNLHHQILDLWTGYPVKAIDGYATLALTSFCFAV
jgi:hypothetical protein